MDKYGFVYVWYDSGKSRERGIRKRFYIGCHWGTEDDGYICSSDWMKKSYKSRCQDFKRRIIKTKILSKKETFEEETKWLTLIKSEELGKRYYNFHKTSHHWSSSEDGIKNIQEKRKQYVPTEATRQKQSLAKQGKWQGIDNPNYNPLIRTKITAATTGLKRTDEQRQGMREAQSKIDRTGEDNHFFGKRHSEETLAKMRKPKTAEHKAKLSAARIGKEPWNKGKKKCHHYDVNDC